MKTHSIASAVLLVSIVALASIVVGPTVARAATTPSLGSAQGYGALGGTYTNTTVTTINGSVGFTTGPAVAPLGVHPFYGSGAPYSTAQTNAGSALASLNAQPCTFTFAAGPIDISTDVTHGPIGVYTPGVYCSTGAMNVGGPITLSGSGTYIFRPTGALTSTVGATVTLTGASECNVFWTPTAATTLAANTSFAGTILDNANAITIGANSSLLGRALSLGAGVVTTDTDTISVPVCATPGGGRSTPYVAPIFPLINITKIPSPLALPAGPGTVHYAFTLTNVGMTPVSGIEVTDDKCSPVEYVSGDTNHDSILDLAEAWVYGCSQVLNSTQTDVVTARGYANGGTIYDRASAIVVVGAPQIPPLIHLVKRPSVFALPAVGGPVTYEYTVTNPGTEPLHDVTITDDTCTGLPGRVTGHPGDVNKNNLLEPSESWSFTCDSTISKTTTNTATAQGSANGYTVTDDAVATVTVAGAIPRLPSTGVANDGIGTWLMLVISSFLAGSLITHMFWRQRAPRPQA